jgi:hypothetical protein
MASFGNRRQRRANGLAPFVRFCAREVAPAGPGSQGLRKMPGSWDRRNPGVLSGRTANTAGRLGRSPVIVTPPPGYNGGSAVLTGSALCSIRKWLHPPGHRPLVAAPVLGRKDRAVQGVFARFLQVSPRKRTRCPQVSRPLEYRPVPVEGSTVSTFRGSGAKV